MRKISVIILILFAGIVTLAQTFQIVDDEKDNTSINFSGKKHSKFLAGPSEKSIVNLEIDWSYLRIEDLSITDWISLRRAEIPENNAQEELDKELKPEIAQLTQEINDKWRKVNLVLAVKEGCKYTLLVRPMTFDRKGNNTIQSILIDNETNDSIATYMINGHGGHWGSLSNLWGDGYRDAGQKIGKKMSKILNDSSSKR